MLRRSAAFCVLGTLSCLIVVAGFFWHQPVAAQVIIPSPPVFTPSDTTSTSDLLVVTSTESAIASGAAERASSSAVLDQKIQEKQDKDITATGGQQKSKLAAFLDSQPITELAWNNFVQHALRDAINRGLPANIVVLVILFPVIASIIAFSRHIIGMKGFGIYTPAVLSVAFVSTGIGNGIALFLVTLMAAVVTRKVIKKLNLQYLPRTALLFWGVSIVMLGALIAATYMPFNIIVGVSIFPLLIIMLLTENFIESQLTTSQSAAIRLTVETLITAIFCSVIINSEMVQRAVILQPELTLLVVAGFNFAIGRYTGLRLLEWLRFRTIIDE